MKFYKYKLPKFYKIYEWLNSNFYLRKDFFIKIGRNYSIYLSPFEGIYCKFYNQNKKVLEIESIIFCYFPSYTNDYITALRRERFYYTVDNIKPSDIETNDLIEKYLKK